MADSSFKMLYDDNIAAKMQPSNFANPDTFTSNDRTELNHFFYQAADGSTLTGVWKCAPAKEEFESYPVDEMMMILSGSLTLTQEGGQAETFTSGDVLFIPKGSKVIWENTETLQKFYMMAE